MLKRAFDFLVSIALIALLSPVMLAIAVAEIRWMGFPIFFRQQRPGLQGIPFEVIKFRTMLEESQSDGQFLPDEVRLTRLGAFLRRYSLDELPQLFNVLRGDMSLVGPRPLLMEYLPLYSSEQARRHDVRPGITGWAQINGRNDISWEEKFALDVWYVDNCTFWLDLKILAKTISHTFRGSGVSKAGFATTDKFLGSGHTLDA
jgi:sugar transferase EpsL